MMGALVGGLHVAGSLGAYARWYRTRTQHGVWRLLDHGLRAPGVIRTTKSFANHRSRYEGGPPCSGPGEAAGGR